MWTFTSAHQSTLYTFCPSCLSSPSYKCSSTSGSLAKPLAFLSPFGHDQRSLQHVPMGNQSQCNRQIKRRNYANSGSYCHHSAMVCNSCAVGTFMLLTRRILPGADNEMRSSCSQPPPQLCARFAAFPETKDGLRKVNTKPETIRRNSACIHDVVASPVLAAISGSRTHRKSSSAPRTPFH